MSNLEYFYLDRYGTRYMFEFVDGCCIGCPYCNAYTDFKKLGYLCSWDEWINPKIKPLDANVIKQESEIVKKTNANLDFIMVCSTSDPFQRDDIANLSQKYITVLNELELTTRVLTKAKIPDFYLELDPNKNEIGITVENLTRLEIHKAIGNIDKMTLLQSNGFHTFVSLQPFDLTIDDENFKQVLKDIKFANHIVFGILDDQPLSDFNRAFDLSDMTAEFCISNNKSFFNGSPRFTYYCKRRLRSYGITTAIQTNFRGG